jgi:hypothetical protein
LIEIDYAGDFRRVLILLAGDCVAFVARDAGGLVCGLFFGFEGGTTRQSRFKEYPCFMYWRLKTMSVGFNKFLLTSQRRLVTQKSPSRCCLRW